MDFMTVYACGISSGVGVGVGVGLQTLENGHTMGMTLSCHSDLSTSRKDCLDLIERHAS